MVSSLVEYPWMLNKLLLMEKPRAGIYSSTLVEKSMSYFWMINITTQFYKTHLKKNYDKWKQKCINYVND